MTVFLLIIAVVVPVWLAFRFCITRGGVEINHLLMFTFGYLFYWMLPIAIGMSRLFESNHAMRYWYPLFDAVQPEALDRYLVTALACYLAFAAGTMVSRRWFARPESVYRRTFFYPRLLDIPLVCALLASAVYTVILRGEFFHGYADRDATTSGVDTRGPFIAWSLVLLVLAFLYSAKRHEDSGFTASFGAVIRNRYLYCYLVVALLILSLGGRLYFISSLVILLAYRSVYFKRISPRLALVTVLGLSALSGLIGLLRLNVDLNPTDALLNVYIESLFTSFSLLHFLGDNIFEWVKFPIFLLSSFANLLPTAVLPNKASLIIAPGDYGYVAFAPAGALNSYFSFMINFGFLGTLAFLFLFSCFLNYLKIRDRNLLFRVTYGMLTGWIGFTFFRDAFFISLVKSMFQFSVLTPWVIIVVVQLLSVALRDRGRALSVPVTDEGAPTA